jgi:transcriptional regulator with XRE-family HTH domain
MPKKLPKKQSDSLKAFGARLRAIRDDKPMSRHKLAEKTGKAGVTELTILRIELGQIVNPSLDTIRALADALEVSPSELIDY